MRPTIIFYSKQNGTQANDPIPTQATPNYNATGCTAVVELSPMALRRPTQAWEMFLSSHTFQLHTLWYGYDASRHSWCPPPVSPWQLTDKFVTIPAKSVLTSHKTSLGHHKAPAGQNCTQLRIICTNSDTHAKLVSTSPCNRMDWWFFYTTIYLTSLC
jgi:hypothetical protein